MRAERGLALGQIAKQLGVSKSSVSTWVRDIVLSPAQHEALSGENAMYERQRYSCVVRTVRCRHERTWWQIEGRVAARRGDPLHAAGCMLFWAEGSKHRNVAQLANSDPELIRLWVAFLRAEFAVEDDALRVTCNLFADHVHRQREIEDFWLSVIAAPRSCLTKSIVNHYSRSSARKRVNMLPYGTCRVTVHRTRIAQHLFGAIQEYGAFERSEWLD